MVCLLFDSYTSEGIPKHIRIIYIMSKLTMDIKEIKDICGKAAFYQQYKIGLQLAHLMIKANL